MFVDSVLGKLNTLAHFPFRSVSTSEFYLTKIKRSQARQTSASPRTVPLPLPLQQGAGKSVPVFCFLSIRLAATLSQACIMNAHARSPSHTSPSNEVSLSPVLTESLRATRGAQRGGGFEEIAPLALLFFLNDGLAHQRRRGLVNDTALRPPIPKCCLIHPRCV